MRSPYLHRQHRTRGAQITASPDMFRPGQDDTSKVYVGPGLKALQSACFDQIVAELAEAKCGLVVAETRAGNHGKHDIGEARTIAVAVLEAEIDRSAGDQGNQVRIREQGRRHEPGQNIESREGCRVAHQGQIDEFLDRAAAELRPDPLVFAPHFLFRRMRRPVDAQMPEVVETDGNGASGSDRASCTDPRASTRPSLVPPYLRRGLTAPPGAAPRPPARR